MHTERRRDERQAQDDLKRMLNKHQSATLREMEKSGWKILFIRNHLFQPVTTVLGRAEDGAVVVLEEDGSINEKHDLAMRKDIKTH
jgi:hypothetical protein